MISTTLTRPGGSLVSQADFFRHAQRVATRLGINPQSPQQRHEKPGGRDD